MPYEVQVVECHGVPVTEYRDYEPERIEDEGCYKPTSDLEGAEIPLDRRRYLKDCPWLYTVADADEF